MARQFVASPPDERPAWVVKIVGFAVSSMAVVHTESFPGRGRLDLDGLQSNIPFSFSAIPAEPQQSAFDERKRPKVAHSLAAHDHRGGTSALRSQRKAVHSPRRTGAGDSGPTLR